MSETELSRGATASVTRLVMDRPLHLGRPAKFTQGKEGHPTHPRWDLVCLALVWVVMLMWFSVSTSPLKLFKIHFNQYY